MTHLDLLDSQLNLPETLVLLLVQVTERELNHTTFERVIGVFCKSDEVIVGRSQGSVAEA